MAFTDPIVAGNELIRAAIQSANYIPGSQGWSVFKNGSAEFDALSLRGPLSTPGITLNGVDLASALNARALGVVAWMIGNPTTATTTQAAIMFVEADMIAGRMYEISCVSITPDMGSVDGTEYHLRYVQGTSGWPSNSSTLLTMTLRLSQFKLGTIRTYFVAPATDRFRFRTSIVSLDGATVRNWSPGSCIMAITDLGIPPGAAGSVGINPPGVSLREFTIDANDVQSYTSANNSTLNALVQGNYDSTNRGWLGWWTFDAAARALLDDVAGVALANIDTCRLYLSADYWINGSGTVILGYHNTTSLGAGLPGGASYNQVHIAYPGAVAGWTSLKGVASIMNAINSSALEGFVLGNPNENNNVYAGLFTGVGSPYLPKLHVKYYK